MTQGLIFLGSLLLFAVAAGALGFMFGSAHGIEVERKRLRLVGGTRGEPQ